MTPRAAGILAILITTAAAQAAGNVELKMEIDPDNFTWRVVAAASPASLSGAAYDFDNAGLAGFAIDLAGISTATSGAPRAYEPSIDAMRGFSVYGTLYDPYLDQWEAMGGQLGLDPNTVVYGVGQQAGATPPVLWDQPAVVCYGQFSQGQFPRLLGGEATVFVSDQSVLTTAAAVHIIPEPAVLALLTFGAAALRRRRKR